MIRKRAFFTLVEVLIVIAILAGITGVIGVNIQKILGFERFQSEVIVVLDKLRQAQDLMLIEETDVTFFLSREGNNYFCKLAIEKPLTPLLKKKLETPVILKTIRDVNFLGVGTPSQQSDIKMTFFAGGSLMDKGRIKFSALKGEFEDFIDLAGYPNALEKGVDMSAITNLQRESEDVYPKELVQED